MRGLLLSCLVFVAGILLVASPAESRPKTDLVIMDNGDRINAEIKSLDRGKLSVKTDALGTLSIKWPHVAWIYSDFQFRIELEDGEEYLGTFGSAPDTGSMAIVTVDTTVIVSLANVVAIVPLEKTFWQRQSGSLSLGFTYTQASDIAQLNFNYRNTYTTENNVFDLTLSANFTVQEKEDPTERQDYSLSYQRELKQKKLYGSGGLSFTSNDELGIAARTAASLAPGIRWIRNNRTVLSNALGLSVNREASTDTADATYNLEGIINFVYQYFRFDSPKSDINSKLNVYPSLSSWGRVRLTYELVLSHELISDFTVNWNFYNAFDSDPPAEGAAKNDWNTGFSLGWTY